MLTRLVLAALASLALVACSSMPCALGGQCFRTSAAEASAASTRTATSSGSCNGYQPACIGSDSICSVDANGCRICTCQSRLGDTAPYFMVPGTSAPAPPMR